MSQTGAGGKSVVSGNKIVYGPYSNVQPRSFELATAHFENLHPLITITDLRRDIEVSHWGKNLAVEEHYALRNDGARYVIGDLFVFTQKKLICNFFF